MQFHLEHRLRLHTEPKFKSLYEWALTEIDSKGHVGEDQIPWTWSLTFTATSCVLRDKIDIETKSRVNEVNLPTPEISQQQIISMQLRPGYPRDDEDDFRATKFSMLGTDRVVKNFGLDIYELPNPGDQERCSSWGTLSYTSETDFREETNDDYVGFYLWVRPDTFARYAEKISKGQVDELIFTVGLVSGFYSEWSPSISTRSIKILTRGGEHKVELPAGVKFEPPALGEVGKAELLINRRLEYSRVQPNAVAVPDSTRAETDAPRADAGTLAADGMKSVRCAAWLAVFLLALIFFAIVLQR